MLTLFTLRVVVGAVVASSGFFSGNGTSIVGGKPGVAGVPPMENGLLGSCKCGGGEMRQFGSETVAMYDGGYGCIGSCGGSAWEIHAYGQLVKKIEMWWGGGVPNDGMGGLCVILTDGSHKCVGTENRGNHCEYTFDTDNGEQLWTLALHGNGWGSRVGRLEFRTMLNDGTSRSFACGNSHTKYEATNVDGKMFAGFFGLAGADLDQLGILLASPTCDVVKREITNVECVNKQGENCLSTWTDGGQFATVQQGCRSCDTSQSTSCSFGFSLAQTHMVTTTSATIDTAGGTLAYAGKFEASFLGLVKAETTVTISASYSRTWSSSEAQMSSTIATVKSDCTVNLEPWHAVKAYGNMRAGTMVADMKFTVTTTTACGQVTEEVHDGSVTMTNVAVLADISTCTFEDIDCDATESPTATPAPTPEPSWTYLENTNISGGDIQGCSSSPGEDIREDDAKIAKCQEECERMDVCFAIVCHPWGTMLKAYSDSTESTYGYKTYVLTRSSPLTERLAGGSDAGDQKSLVAPPGRLFE